MTGLSVVIVGILIVVRYGFGNRGSVRGSVDVVQPKVSTSTSKISFHDTKDFSNNNARKSMVSVSLFPSPTQHPFLGSSEALTCSDERSTQRLHVEIILDNPIRARSLVRRSRVLVRCSGDQVYLLPASYLRAGIVLVGKSMKTRCGFFGVVEPVVHAREHKMAPTINGELHQELAMPNLR